MNDAVSESLIMMKEICPNLYSHLPHFQELFQAFESRWPENSLNAWEKVWTMIASHASCVEAMILALTMTIIINITIY